MWVDPIVEETKKLRESYAQEHNYDMDAIFQDIKKRQFASGRQLLSRPSRRPQFSFRSNATVADLE